MADQREWEDDEEEEDEDDFIPDGDDDDDDAFDVEEEEDDDDGSFPTFLNGQLFVDKSKGLCYEEEGAFCLVCQTSLNEPFNFQSPPVDKPLVFAGWVKNPSQWFEFNVTFSKEAEPTDELELKLLKTQEEKKGMNGGSGNSKDDSPVKGHLKAPPAYSVGDDDEEEGKKGPAKGNLKSPPSYSTTTTAEGTVFVISATCQGDEGGEEKGRRINFRGMYRPPTTPISRLYLISAVQIEENSTANNNGTSKAAPVVAAAAAAAPARKRGRSNRDDDDDDSVEGGGGVEYQELIDLHDDAGLSTEELRRRYYGGGNRDDDEEDAKKPSSSNSSSKRMKGSSAAAKKNDDDDDDDDDDAYGF